MSDDLRAANPERWARARELLEIGKSLMELDEEANSLGTDSWAWLRQVEDFLAASSNPASVQASLESLKLEIRKQAFEEAAEHEPGEYLGCRGYDWECRCGTCGVWRDATNWPDRIRWPDHIRALASAPAVNEEPEGKK